MKNRVRDVEGDELEELRSLLEIDKHSLDDEIVRQPQTFFKISEASVKATAHRDFCKEEIKRVDADLAAAHRRKIEKSGARATDSAVSSAVAADPKHQKAVDRYIKANQRAELLNALREAFSQRSYMLRDLSTLFVANYFEKTSVTDNSTVRGAKADANMDRMAEARKAKGSLVNRRTRSKK